MIIETGDLCIVHEKTYLCWCFCFKLILALIAELVRKVWVRF